MNVVVIIYNIDSLLSEVKMGGGVRAIVKV